MRRVLISTEPFIFVLFPVGITVRSAESLSSAIPLGTSTERANSKKSKSRTIAVFFKMPFRPCPSGCGRFLSADDGHDRCLQCLGRRHAEAAFVEDSCVCCRVYEHDFAAISPFLYERIGTLCRHPCWSLWLEQRIAGWRSGRSEGYCKSLSAGHAPTDLLLLTQRTSRPVPGWFRWSVPRGAQHFIRCAICR